MLLERVFSEQCGNRKNLVVWSILCKKRSDWFIHLTLDFSNHVEPRRGWYQPLVQRHQQKCWNILVVHFDFRPSIQVWAVCYGSKVFHSAQVRWEIFRLREEQGPVVSEVMRLGICVVITSIEELTSAPSNLQAHIQSCSILRCFTRGVMKYLCHS